MKHGPGRKPRSPGGSPATGTAPETGEPLSSAPTLAPPAEWFASVGAEWNAPIRSVSRLLAREPVLDAIVDQRGYIIGDGLVRVRPWLKGLIDLYEWTPALYTEITRADYLRSIFGVPCSPSITFKRAQTPRRPRRPRR